MLPTPCPSRHIERSQIGVSLQCKEICQIPSSDLDAPLFRPPLAFASEGKALLFDLYQMLMAQVFGWMSPSVLNLEMCLESDFCMAFRNKGLSADEADCPLQVMQDLCRVQIRQVSLIHSAIQQMQCFGHIFQKCIFAKSSSHHSEIFEFVSERAWFCRGRHYLR